MFMHGCVTEYPEIKTKNSSDENMKYILSFWDSFDKAKKLCKNEESILKAEKLKTGSRHGVQERKV